MLNVSESIAEGFVATICHTTVTLIGPVPAELSAIVTALADVDAPDGSAPV